MFRERSNFLIEFNHFYQRNNFVITKIIIACQILLGATVYDNFVFGF